jgi:hypothetical protein
MAKFFKAATQVLIIALLFVILWTLLKGQTTSSYMGAPVSIQPGPAVAKLPGSVFDIQPSLDCTAGPSEKADYYSRGLTPGGLCGGSAYVREQIRDFAIVDGIGGSLLEK